MSQGCLPFRGIQIITILYQFIAGIRDFIPGTIDHFIILSDALSDFLHICLPAFLIRFKGPVRILVLLRSRVILWCRLYVKIHDIMRAA